MGYISLDALVAATHVPKDDLCRACFDSIYPVPLPEPELLGKHLLEGIERAVGVPRIDVDRLDTFNIGGGASGALQHP